MKTENREILGYTVPIVGIVETLAEAVAAAGSEETVLKDYNNNVLAHSHYTIVRRAITKKLVELTGIKQRTEKDGDKDVIVERDAEYKARLESELGEEEVAKFEKAIAEVIGAMPVDYTPGTRGAGGTAAPAKKWLDYYDQLVTEKRLDAFCQKHSIDQSVDEAQLKNTVALKVKEVVTAKMEAARKQALEV
jgi:hypothetical protein